MACCNPNWLSSLRVRCDASHTGIFVGELQCVVMVEVLTAGADVAQPPRSDGAGDGGEGRARVAPREWRERRLGRYKGARCTRALQRLRGRS